MTTTDEATTLNEWGHPVVCPVTHEVVEGEDGLTGVPIPTAAWVGRMPWWDYHILKAARSSDLRIVATYSLARLKVEREQVDDDAASDAMIRGKGFHAIVLEPETEWKRYVRAPDWLTNRARKKDKEEWNGLVEEHGEHRVFRAKEYDGIVGQRDMIFGKPLYAALMAKGSAEVTVVWRDEETGLWCKARLDWLTDITGRGTIVDLKGCPDARPEKFVWKVDEFRYDLQGAHYLTGCAAVGLDIKDYAILASEWAEPYDCRLFRMRDADLVLAEFQRDDVLALIAKAEETDVWSGYPEEPTTIGLPFRTAKRLQEDYQMRMHNG